MTHNIPFNFKPVRITKNTITVQMREATIKGVHNDPNLTLDLITGLYTETLRDGSTRGGGDCYKYFLKEQRRIFAACKVSWALRSVKPIIYIKWD